MTDDNYSEIAVENAVWNYEAMMERMLQDPSIAETIIRLFLEDVPVQLDNLNASIDQESLKQIRQYSHAIKGSALNLGGETMYAVAESIEEQALKGNVKKIISLNPLLVEQFKKLEKLLINHLEKIEK